MDIVPLDLAAAAAGARERLAELSRDAALQGTRSSAAPGARLAFSAAAREAIFADALLGAVHARFEELKSVAK